MRVFLGTIALRVGLAFVFFYAAISGFVSPDNWIGYFPSFMRELFPERIMLIVFGVTEVILAILILLKRNVTWPALVAAMMLLGITFVNLPVFDVVFRDVGLALAAVALCSLGKVRN